MIPSKRLTAAHKQLLAMKMCTEETSHVMSPSVSSEWRSKYLGKLHINSNCSTGVPRDCRAGTDPTTSTRTSAPIMIPTKTRSTSLEDSLYQSPLLSWEQPNFMNNVGSSPHISSNSSTKSVDSHDIDLDIGLFPMGSPEDSYNDLDRNNSLDDDDDYRHDVPVISAPRNRRREFIPPHQMIQRDCFSLGVQHQFRKRPTGAAVI